MKRTLPTIKKKNTGKRKYPFQFSLVYAPELTTIGFSYIDKPGSNYGLMVGYPIFKNLILQTGIIKSRKNYISNGDDFVTGYQLPINHTLTKVDGYCSMYEIPLYTSQKNYWWSLATAGLSIEKEITPAVYIAAMPFIKIPFKGMGEGNLKLLSTGINFSLSYQPSLTKK